MNVHFEKSKYYILKKNCLDWSPCRMLLSCNFQAYDFVQQKIFLVPNSAIPSKLKLTIFQNAEIYPQFHWPFLLGFGEFIHYVLLKSAQKAFGMNALLGKRTVIQFFQHIFQSDILNLSHLRKSIKIYKHFALYMYMHSKTYLLKFILQSLCER